MYWTVSVCTPCRSEQKSLIPRSNQPQITPYFHVYTGMYKFNSYMCVCMCVCMCVHMCACVHMCVGACVNVCKWGPDWNQHDPKIPQRFDVTFFSYRQKFWSHEDNLTQLLHAWNTPSKAHHTTQQLLEPHANLWESYGIKHPWKSPALGAY